MKHGWITMINDAKILKLVMDRCPEQPIPFIIEQFTELKAGLVQANSKLAAAESEEIPCEAKSGETTQDADETAPKKKFIKRNLVVRPEESIGDDSVTCCLCGRSFQNLTIRHLFSHGISVEEYKKLCGFAPEQTLICKNLLTRLQENVQKAQQARGAKKA